jgi:hypothetical protein
MLVVDVDPLEDSVVLRDTEGRISAEWLAQRIAAELPRIELELEAWEKSKQ